VFARGEEVSLDAHICGGSLLIASGDVRGPDLLMQSVVIAGGDVVLKGARNAIIICDGNVAARYASGCLIVARGKVPGPPTVRGCFVHSGNCYVDPDGKRTTLGEGTPDPFAIVKFFELSDVGLAVAERDRQGEAVRDGVFLKEVRKGTLFAPGLQAGDIVTAIDGTKATSQEVFRKLLRKQLAQGGPRITFTVRRAGQTTEVAVPVKD
jgi:membrane-associated protease RseP (regulator of RpoE activity)